MDFNSNPPASFVADERNRVTTAFLLGWAVSETLGLVRQGVRPPSRPKGVVPDYAPRLTVSDGVVDTPSDALLLNAERVVQFHRRLCFDRGAAVSLLTQEVEALPDKTRAWLEGKTPQFYSQGDLRELLEAWTLEVWAQLNSASDESARALTAGMSLADTYWYMRLPSRRPGLKSKQLSAEDWHRLLSRYRLDVERSRLRTLQNNLPRYVIPVIRRHLQAWSIGTELCYRDGKLMRRAGGKENAHLTAEDEARLQRALERQAQRWEAMLFGLREAATFLLARDRRLITAGRLSGLFLVLLATALFLVIGAAVIAYYISATVLLFLAQRQAGISDWLTLVSLLWTILIALPVPLVLRAAYQFTRGAQTWLDDQLTIWFITRRTYVPWDRYMEKAKDQGTKSQIESGQGGMKA